ncbi:conjugal transfer protein TraI [Pedobacter sp. WC2423]|uniref:conjugal transfer protein TraI n=1 Tax=Pedobacter sp. WC2423 TaxID=3234142 RepID=UPI003467B17C
MILLFVIFTATNISAEKANAQLAYLEIIKAGVKKVIKAVDLQVQRLQNNTIWLQNAQKTLENTMSKLKLDEISDWANRQKSLYKDYYDELYKVKMLISYYKRIRDISDKQVRLVQAYQRAWQLTKKDPNFSPQELEYIGKVYSGILDESLKNIDQIFLVVNSFQTQMSDAKRLEIINSAADQVDDNYNDLTRFNQQNIMLSLQRARTGNDVLVVKKLYGLAE